MIDLAVLAQDPRFPGGSRALAEAFRDGATELDREPRLFWLAYRGLRAYGQTGSGEASRALLPGLDGLNQLAAARRVRSRVRAARSVWVVSAVASHGYGAALSGRRYGAWVATAHDEEWAARRRAVGPARRTAHALSAGLLRRLERETLRRAARVYAVSPASGAALARAADLDPEDVAVLPIPIDTTSFAPAPDETWQGGLERPVLAFVGRRDDPRKNLRLLLEAFPEIRRRVPHARLLLVGPGPAARPTDGIDVAGEVPDVAAAIRRATLFVLPSLQEGFGIVAAEALASGLPVVTTPSGGPEDLVGRSGGGRILESFDAEELAAAVVELLEAPGTLAAMRRAGREHVAREHAPGRFRTLLAEALREVDER